MPGRLYWWIRKLAYRAHFALQRDPAREEQSLVCWPRKNSAQLFYVFQGRELQLMMDPMTFLAETGLIHANLVMLRDYQRFFYHGGLNRELPDIDAVRERLLACRRQLPHVSQSFCLGSSAGGYAAILFGHYLNVDAVYAFAPQTLIDLERLQAVARRNDIWRFPETHRDLALLLAGHNGQTRYKVYYCEDNAIDRRSAERIGGCPGVELYPQPGDAHVVIRELHRAGRLRDLLPLAAGMAEAEIPKANA